MRSSEEARKCWPQLDDVTSIGQLRKAVSAAYEPRITSGLRSICWKIFLLFNTLDRSSWPTSLTDSRTAYDSLRSHFLRAIEHPDEIESVVDPLSENEESPWVALRKDEILRAEIFQDVERCMPDNMYFRQPSTQNMMLDIIFIFCKLNPDIGYRQGMHEVLAPILWVVERDAIDPGSIERGRNTGSESRLLHEICDNRFVEHDTFTLFQLVMKNAKFFYAPAEGGSGSSQSVPQNDTPMLIRSRRIFEQYLPMADPILAAHLKKMDIVPQIFLMRWIRLLFGREFPFDDVLVMWDMIFAQDSSLEIVDYICLAMLLRIRWDLVEADTNTAFTLLLRYPEPDNPPHTFVHDALYLRDNLNPRGGGDIIATYGKKSPPISENESRVSSRARSPIGASKSLVQQPGSLEAILQDAARGVYNQGEKWGIAKTVRDAIGEVKKNVQTMQSNSGQSTPRSGGREYRKPARPVLKSTPSNSDVLRRVSTLESRNKGLAKMLEGALSELWECHKEKSDQTDVDKESLEALSVAIARVQFVQVYLEDSSIPLPVEEDKGKQRMKIDITPERTASAPPTCSPTSSRTPTSPPIKQSRPQRTVAGSSSSQLDMPIDIPSRPTALRGSTSRITATPTTTAPSPSPPSPSRSISPRARPALAQSSFSWMLGQDERTSAFASASAHTAFPSDEKRRMARGKESLGGKGYLFGEDDEEGSPTKDSRAKGKGNKAEKEIEEEVIDLGPLSKSAVA